MKLKLLTIIGMLITLNVSAEPVTNESIDKAFEGSTEIVSYKTNAVMEGFAGMGVGFANATEPLLGELVSEPAANNTKLIGMDKNPSTAFKAGKLIGTTVTTIAPVIVTKHADNKELAKVQEKADLDAYHILGSVLRIEEKLDGKK